MRKLEITVSPGSDETLVSSISRLAAANGAADVHDFCWHTGIAHQAIVDGNLAEIAKLVELAGFERGALQWRHVVRDGLFFEINGERLGRSNFMRHRLRYCPHCFQEDIAHGAGPKVARPYGRASWCVTFIRICSKHHTILKTAAPFEVGSSLDFSRIVAAEMASPGFDAPSEPCRKTTFETYVDERLSGLASTDRWIDAMPLYVAGQLCETVGATILLGKKYDSSQVSDKDWIRAAEAGYQVLGGGQGAFEIYLKWLHGDFWQRNSISVGHHLYGRLYDYLDHESGDPAYDPLRRVVYEVAMNDLPLGFGDELFGPVRERRNHSIITAAREFKIDSRTLRERLHRARLIKADQAQMPNSRIIIPREAIEQEMRSTERTLLWTEARAYLGVRLAIWNLLTKTGAVPVSSVRTDAVSPLYNRADLDQFLDLAFGMIKCEFDPARDLKSMHEAVAIAKCKIGAAVELFLSGQLETVARDPDTFGFDGLRFDPEELRIKSRPHDHGLLTVRDAMIRLGLDYRVARKLIERGYLSSEEVVNPLTRRRQQMLEPESVAAFRTEFISLFALARARKKHALQVRGVLQRKGVDVAISSDEVGATFYRRSEL